MRLADLHTMTQGERDKLLDRFVADSNLPTNGQLEAVTSRIKGFELRYEMPSAKLIEKLRREEIEETAEISEWLFLLSVRDRRESRKARAEPIS